MGTFGMRRVTLIVTAQGAERGASQGQLTLQNDIHLMREREGDLHQASAQRVAASLRNIFSY